MNKFVLQKVPAAFFHTMTFRMPHELHLKLKNYCKRENVKQGDTVIQMIEHCLTQNETPEIN